MDDSFQKNLSVVFGGKRKPSVYSDSPQIKSLPKLSSDLNSLHPELCLIRKNTLEEDKRRKVGKLFSSRSPRDISHLLDLSERTPRKKAFFPNSLEEMHKWLYDNQARHPTGLKEIDNLSNWLKEMKRIHLPELETKDISDFSPSCELVERVESIYVLALSEIMRQISVQCKSRADLLKIIIDMLEKVWKKYPDHLKDLMRKQKESYLKLIENTKQFHSQKEEETMISLLHLEKKIKSQEHEKESLHGEISSLKKHISKIHWEYEEFFKYKNKLSRLISTGSQTDVILEDFERKSDLSDDSSLTEEPSPQEEPIRHSTSLLKIQHRNSQSISSDKHSKDEFISEFRGVVKDIEMQSEIDVNSLVSLISQETSDYKTWLQGFKMALNFMPSPSKNKPNPIELEPESKITRAQKMNKNLTISTKYRYSYSRKNNVVRGSAESSTLITPRDTSAGLISGIVAQPMSKISKIAKTSNKKLLKYINNFIYTAISKKYNKTQSFAECIYASLLTKYNMKSIAERKFQEFVSGCLMHYAENHKISLFLRCIKAGSKYGLSDLSNEGCEMYVKIYEFMVSSKIGVLLETVDPLAAAKYPAARALECARYKLEGFLNKKEMASLIESIEKITIADQSYINKSGLVNIDEFAEIAINLYEKRVTKIKTGVNMCVSLITDYNYLTRGETSILLRNLCPNKFRKIFKSFPFDDKNEIEVSEFLEISLSLSILSVDSVSQFFLSYNKNVKAILEQIHEHREAYLSVVGKTSQETLSVEEWENKLDDLIFKLRGTDPTRYLQLWHLLRKELEYLKNL